MQEHRLGEEQSRRLGLGRLVAGEGRAEPIPEITRRSRLGGASLRDYFVSASTARPIKREKASDAASGIAGKSSRSASKASFDG